MITSQGEQKLIMFLFWHVSTPASVQAHTLGVSEQQDCPLTATAAAATTGATTTTAAETRIMMTLCRPQFDSGTVSAGYDLSVLIAKTRTERLRFGPHIV